MTTELEEAEKFGGEVLIILQIEDASQISRKIFNSYYNLFAPVWTFSKFPNEKEVLFGCIN